MVTSDPGGAAASLTTRGGDPAALVDLGGATALAGYAVLAWVSHDFPGTPGLPGFYGLLAWVSVPWLLVFLAFRERPEALPVQRLLLWAVLFRLCGVFGVPPFEDDWFRYLWDGYRFVETGTPYAWAPAASFLDADVPAAMQRILDQVNYPDLPTIYGPTAEYLFALGHLLSPGSLVPLQLLLIGADLLLLRLLLSTARPAFVLLYAWCPLVVKEIAFAAHPDGLGVCLAFAAIVLRKRELFVAAGICLALAIGTKVFALLLAPFVLARAPARTALVLAGTLALLYLPFVLQGGTDLPTLAIFAATWEFNSALYGLVAPWLSPGGARVALGAVLVALAAAYWLHYRRHTPGEIPRGDWIFGACLAASPVINPWYALWFLPFAVVYPSRWAWTAATAVLLAYVTGLNLDAMELDPFAQPWWVRPVEFGVILAAMGVDVWRARGTPAPRRSAS